MSVDHGGPIVTRRRLRTDLRRIREEQKLSLHDVSDRMEWSVSKLIRIENGSVSISVNDLRILLSLYGVEDEATVERLLNLARGARQKAWWNSYRPYVAPTFLEFLGYEAAADRIKFFQPLILPGLLQTRPYAAAICAGLALDDPSDPEMNARVELRARRKDEVLGRSNPPNVLAIIDESVLRRRVGGADVMREQLDHLLDLSYWPSIDIRVVPHSAGAYVGLTGPFCLLAFPDPEDSEVVFLETTPTDVIIRDRPDQIAAYVRAFERLDEVAVGGEAGTNLIAEVRATLG
jgi:transcriptional regulator with XRE-family HTH domain